MKKNLLLAFMLIFAFESFLFSQEKTITGKVTSMEDESPLPGVNIVLKGTNVGTITDVSGEYTIMVPESGAVLSFSFVGYLSEEVEVGTKFTIDVGLTPDILGLEEVVVTALGIQKKAIGLSYSTQDVDGEELTQAKEVNMINSLAGKAAGVSISRSASGVGGSSRVIIRGNKSITSLNQPLYVIDGIPMNTSTLGQPIEFYYAVDNGDAVSNLNPEDIESINVLRGAAASALYGSQAANGVILITTKKGTKGEPKFEFSSTASWENPLMLPELQDTYGPVDPENSVSTWGNADNGSSSSHVKDFFETGSNYINSLSVTSGNELGSFYASYANTSSKGIVPENTMQKNNFTVTGSTKAYDKLTIEAGANFINQKIENKPYLGTYYNPVLSTYLFTETAEQFEYYRDNYEVFDPVRNMYVQNYPTAHINQVFTTDNPYWLTNKNYNESLRNRGIFNFKAKLEITEDLSLQGRINYDRVSDKFEHRVYATSSNVVNQDNGEYFTRSQIATQMYSDILLSYNKIFSDMVSVDATAGFSNTYSTSYANLFNSISTGSSLYFANLFNVRNLEPGFEKYETESEVLSQALFGTALIGFKNLVFVDLTGRSEWSSTLSDPNKPYFYPSAGLTFVVSELTGTNNIFNFGKARFSYSEVGNALPFGYANMNQPYTQGFDGSAVAPTVMPLSELEPERTSSIELGADVILFNNSVNLDFTYYSNTIKNQVFQVIAPVGFPTANAYINGGEIKNSGIEAVIGYKAVVGSDFKYETSFNFAKNKNEVIDIDDSLANNYYVVTPYIAGRIAEIRVAEGGSYGDFYGLDLAREENGDLLLNESGAPVPTGTDSLLYMGNPNPDWQLGWSNTFTYKNLSLKILIDGKFGGEVISITESVLDANGRSLRSGEARDAGGVVFEGQTFDTELWYTNTGGLSGVTSQYVYDATNIRLREVVLSYTIPGLFGNAIDKVTISAFGRNLFFFKNDAPFDPESTATTGNGLQGIHMFGIPTTRSFGFNLKVTF
ncbi:MAG: SusC/RagA family TonB-linked outer membrane protein [Bacteroidales bacterium]|nr:SusC/RagA family TonB-linked outer membrane protein [Bacteroidales bacterium]